MLPDSQKPFWLMQFGQGGKNYTIYKYKIYKYKTDYITKTFI